MARSCWKQDAVLPIHSGIAPTGDQVPLAPHTYTSSSLQPRETKYPDLHAITQSCSRSVSQSLQTMAALTGTGSGLQGIAENEKIK